MHVYCEIFECVATLFSFYRSQVVITRAGELRSHTDTTDNQLDLLHCTDGTFKFSCLPNKIHFVGCSARGKGLEESCVAEIAGVKEWIEQL